MIASFLSEIPFPVWFAIGCVVVFLLNHYVKQAVARAKGAVPAPRDVRKAGKEKDWNKLNEHHTPKLRGKREGRRVRRPLARVWRRASCLAGADV